MILPTKHIPEAQSLLGVGAVLLEGMRQPETVTSLWERVRTNQAVGTYERFVLALDLLYITGLIGTTDGLLRRTSP